MSKYYRHELTGLIQQFDDHIAEHPVLGKHLKEVDPKDVHCYNCGITETAPLVLEPVEEKENTETGEEVYVETEEGYGY